jgi:hypothetical protein
MNLWFSSYFVSSKYLSKKSWKEPQAVLGTVKLFSLKTLKFPLIGPLNFELVLQNAVLVFWNLKEGHVKSVFMGYMDENVVIVVSVQNTKGTYEHFL